MTASTDQSPEAAQGSPDRKRGRLAWGLRRLGLLLSLLVGAWFARPWIAGRAIAKGVQAVELRQLDAAWGWFQWAAAIDSNGGEPQFWMARVERLRGRPDQMNLHLEQASKAGYSPLRVHREFVLASAQSGRLREIEGEISGLLMDPGDDGSAICEAVVSGYLQTFRLREAMTIIDAWQRDDPRDPQPRVVRGAYFAQRQSWSKAADEFERALAILPERDDVRIQWADALLNLHELGKAREQFARALESSPENSVALIGLGRCLLEAGEFDAARKQFQQALRFDPQSWEGRFWLGKSLSSNGQYDEALPLLEATCRERPYVPDVRYTLAMALQAAGRKEDAREHFEYVTAQQLAQSELRNKLETLERAPSRADLRVEIGKTLLEYGNPIEGLHWLQSVLEVVPDHPEATAAIEEYMRQHR